VKLKGKIHYKFKGMCMHPESATVVSHEDDLLLVNRDSDNQLLEFVRRKKNWLLKNNDTQESLLFGSCFIFEG
jgi:hypothetical protein